LLFPHKIGMVMSFAVLQLIAASLLLFHVCSVCNLQLATFSLNFDILIYFNFIRLVKVILRVFLLNTENDNIVQYIIIA